MASGVKFALFNNLTGTFTELQISFFFLKFLRRAKPPNFLFKMSVFLRAETVKCFLF